MSTEHDKMQKWWGRALLLLALFAMAYQARTLYIFPIPDSLNYWYGDESWLMSEERTQIETGVIHHPYALGATINKQVGLFLGNTWLSSALYGVPAFVFEHSFPMILIGRTVTFLVALFSVLLLYLILVRWKAGEIWAGFGAIILSTSSAFTIASHSARIDLLIALAVMLVTAYFVERIANRNNLRSSSEAFFFGAIMVIIGFIIWPHLLTLFLLLSAYALFRLSSKRLLPNVVFAGMGALAGLAIICGSYYLLTGDLSMYGTHSQHTQFAEVSAQKPIAHLFSWSVQWNNLTQRIVLLWEGAPSLLALGAVCTAATLVMLVRRHFSQSRDTLAREALICSTLVTISWLLFQGSVSYYLSHILPLFALTLTLLASRSLKYLSTLNLGKVIISAIAVFLVLEQVSFLNATEAASHIFSDENYRAISKLERSELRDVALHQIKSPLLLAELPCAFGLEINPKNRLMYTSFISFPSYDEPAAKTIERNGVNYALLYITPNDSSSIACLPAINRFVVEHGTLIDTAIGTMFDMGRSYLHPDLLSRDTMKLYRLDGK
jgi:hypothetical protein